MDFFPTLVSSSVSALQAALNRFAGRLGEKPITVDGLVGPQTFARLQQVVAVFVPELDTNVWTATGLISQDDVVTYAQDFADSVNTAADRWGGLLNLAPTSADRSQAQAAIKAAGAPPLDTTAGWLWVGGILLAFGTVGWVLWKRQARGGARDGARGGRR